MPERRTLVNATDLNLDTADIAPLSPRRMATDLDRLKQLSNIRPAGYTLGQSSNDGYTVDPPTEPEELPAAHRGRRVRIPIFTETNPRGETYGISIDPDDRGATGVTDSQLLADLLLAIRELGMTVLITDALRRPGESVGAGSKSRHMRGQALDIGAVNGKAAALDHPGKPTNHDAIRLVQWFIQHGYTPGVERGSDRCVLFGNGRWNRTGIPHHHHIHISIR